MDAKLPILFFLLSLRSFSQNTQPQNTLNIPAAVGDSIYGLFYADSKGCENNITILKNGKYTYESYTVDKRKVHVWSGPWYFSGDTLILVLMEALTHEGEKVIHDPKKDHSSWAYKYYYFDNKIWTGIQYGSKLLRPYYRINARQISAKSYTGVPKATAKGYFCEKTHEGVITKEGIKWGDEQTLYGATYFYEQGKLINIFDYKNDVPHGDYKAFYFPSGNIYITGQFKDGKKFGVWNEYDLNGVIVNSKKYHNDEEY